MNSLRNGRPLLHHLFTLVMAALFCLGSTPAMADSPQKGWDGRGAWITYWQLSQGMATLDETPRAFDDVYLFIAHLSPAGDPFLASTKDDYRAIVSRLKMEGKRVWLTVVNDVVSEEQQPLLKDPYIVSRLLSEPQRRRDHIDALLGLAERLGVDGIDIDYENLRFRDRQNFSRFAEELARALHRKKLQLALTVQPKEREKRGQGAGANDWRQLCAVADRLQIMLYNEHSGKTGPGPIASTAWMARVLDFAERQCPIDKLVPAIKIVGAKWNGGNVRGITYQQAIALETEIQRTPVDKIPHFTRQTKTGEESVYYEDKISLAHKLEWLSHRGYRQFVIWRLGGHDPAMDKLISHFKP